MSNDAHTTASMSLSWNDTVEDGGPDTLSLVICWSIEEPERVGESAVIDGKCVLGRGDAAPDDGAPRVVFYRRRPRASTPTMPISASRISRVQLELSPIEDGNRLRVRRVGRCEMLIAGEVAYEAVLEPGDTLVLRHAMVLLVVKGKPFRQERPSTSSPMSFPFGAPDPNGMLGESAAVWALRDELEMAAGSGQHVLLLGQSGTGKELAARAIHALSSRSGGAFVARNASTLPDGLVDAELFGTAKGYPNVGSPERAGLIGEADGGTLFLDEIGELPPHLQSHLLRVLDRGGEFQRLGESRVRHADVRVVAATNRPLEHLKYDFAARFAFRIELLGLEHRRQDIPLLMVHLLQRALQSSPSVQRFFEWRNGALAEPRVDCFVVEALVRHDYTLHVRELERLLWVTLASSPGNYLAMTPELRASLAPGKPEMVSASVNEIDRAAIIAALAATNGSVTKAAQKLGLKNRFALYRLMKRHDMVGEEDEDSTKRSLH